MWGCRKSWQVQEFHQLFTWNFKGFNPKCCRDTPVPVWLSNGSRTCRDYHVCWISRMVLDQSQAEDAFPQLDTNSNCGEDLHLTSRTKPQIHQVTNQCIQLISIGRIPWKSHSRPSHASLSGPSVLSPLCGGRRRPSSAKHQTIAENMPNEISIKSIMALPVLYNKKDPLRWRSCIQSVYHSISYAA